MLPELTTMQQGSVPASAGSTFSAAASSPTALRLQVRNTPLMGKVTVLLHLYSVLCGVSQRLESEDDLMTGLLSIAEQRSSLLDGACMPH